MLLRRGVAYVTDYQYDSRGNLTQTSQTGVPNGGSTSITQTRTFTYDSLSRLLSAVNPESGMVSYEYDADSNLKKKTDARGVYPEYAYDGLNRNTTINYSNTAVNPDITRYYDGATNGKGRFWYDYAGGDYSNGQTVEHKAIDSYDLAGRPLVQRQHFKTGGAWSGAYQTERKYDLAGNATWQKYPSGRTVSYGFDNAGRLNTFSGALGDGTNRNYVLGITYNAANQMRREHFGTATQLYHHLHYTSRGQLYDTRVGTGATDDFSNPTWNRGGLRIFYNSSDVFGNGGSNINGNVWRLDHFVPTSEDASQWSMSVDYFGYDALNRITGVWEQTYYSNAPPNYSAFTQQYVYDRFGNRTVNNAVSNVPGIFNQPFNVEGTTNRLLAPNGTISYDQAGNQTNDGYSGNGARTYDAENRVLTAAGSNGSNSFAYNADGRRVRRVNGSTTTLQVFGIGGELPAEYTVSAPVTASTKEYGYRGGQLLITAEGSNLKWLVTDHLGTARIVLDKSGALTDNPATTTIFEGVIRHDYLP